MARRLRLDAELVRRGLARSRQEAKDHIDAGRVKVGGNVATKPATQVELSAAIVVTEDSASESYVSRGAYKLAGALDALGSSGPAIEGRYALDAGASTGGFTDVLLRRGASHVTAVDVGYGQLAWRLRNDLRVTVMDRTNVRTLVAGSVSPTPDLIVSDLSFISLALVIPALISVAATDPDMLLMVKPQFEVGKRRLGAGGVVRSADDRVWAVEHVVDAAAESGLSLHAVRSSPLPGPSGNVEFFVWLRRSKGIEPDNIHDAVVKAVTEGPQPKKGG